MSTPIWLEPVCRIATQYATGDMSIRDLFRRAAPEVDYPQFIGLVARRLELEPDLVAAWQQYSYDKRGTPTPYLDEKEVGFVEVVDGRARSRGVQRFDTHCDACGAFILRESAWVLHRREIS